MVMKPLRALYDWTMAKAAHRHAEGWLAAISFVEASFFPIPPDVLQIALSASKPRRSFYYAAVSTVASVLGAVAGWVIGYAIWKSVQGLFFGYVPGFTEARFNHVGELYELTGPRSLTFAEVAAEKPEEERIESSGSRSRSIANTGRSSSSSLATAASKTSSSRR